MKLLKQIRIISYCCTNSDPGIYNSFFVKHSQDQLFGELTGLLRSFKANYGKYIVEKRKAGMLCKRPQVLTLKWRSRQVNTNNSKA